MILLERRNGSIVNVSEPLAEHEAAERVYERMNSDYDLELCSGEYRLLIAEVNVCDSDGNMNVGFGRMARWLERLFDARDNLAATVERLSCGEERKG